MSVSTRTQLNAATAGVYPGLAMGSRSGSSPGATPADFALQAYGRAVNDIQAALTWTDDVSTATFLARLADVWRANAFLSIEVGLTLFESLTRTARVQGSWSSVGSACSPRALVLGSVALDIATGYLALHSRARLQPRLVTAQDWELQHQRGATRLLDLATALGGLLIKAGQFLSARPDLLPSAYVRTLATLQDQVPPVDYHIVAGVIQRELGWPFDEVFAAIEYHPLAAASIAQVHRAVLLDGRQVAVKVQYPGTADLVGTDLATLELIVEAINCAQPAIRLQPLVEYLRGTAPLELDFLREARAMQLLRTSLQHRADVYIPEPITDLSSERVLVMEYMTGIPIANRAALIAAGIDLPAVARLLNDVYAEQILRHGLLHADPHPGNLLVQPGPRLVLLDHGLTVELSAAMRQALPAMVRAMASGDFAALATALSLAGVKEAQTLNIESLLRLMGILLGGEWPRPETAVGRLEASLGDLPIELILVGRALSLLYGVSHQLDPELDILERIARYI